MDVATLVAVGTLLCTLAGSVWYVRSYIDASATASREETLRRVAELYARQVDHAVLASRLDGMAVSLCKIESLVTDMHGMTVRAERHHLE